MIDVGDVLCTRNPTGWPAYLIRLGAALRDRPNTVNHVIVVHHRDQAGTLWGVEGRPGGAGWVDVRRALKAPYTIHNADQPKTLEQRAMVAKVAEGMLGTPYDWGGIVADAMEAVGAQALWARKWDDTAPGHVVCSSLADWVYDTAGLPSPGVRFGRTVTPGDWADFITVRGWL